jgi:chromosome segregation ATPase
VELLQRHHATELYQFQQKIEKMTEDLILQRQETDRLLTESQTCAKQHSETVAALKESLSTKEQALKSLEKEHHQATKASNEAVESKASEVKALQDVIASLRLQIKELEEECTSAKRDQEKNQLVIEEQRKKTSALSRKCDDLSSDLAAGHEQVSILLL